MSELTNGLMVFLRVSAMLAVFPVFSAANFPVQLRLALGALLAGLISPALPSVLAHAQDLLGLVGLMAMEVGVGLLFGFVSRMIFFALEIAGAIIGSEIGLSLPPSMNPMSGAQMTAPGSVLYYLAAMLWLSLDLHHWMLVGLMKTYTWLPVGGARLSEVCMADIVARSSQIFVIALQLAAPIMAVSFIVSLVFSVLGRAVPHMNVFHESFTIRTLAGLSVFGITLQLMAEHIINYLRRLPEDMLSVAQMLGALRRKRNHVSEHTGDKTEQATPKRLEQAYNKGQFARSAEVQTAFVLMAALLALTFTGAEMWRLLASSQVAIFSHLNDTPLIVDAMQGYAVQGALALAGCVWPVLVATMLAGLLAGGIQTRFRTSPEALELNWARLNPVEGFRRVFSMRSAVPTTINILKMMVIIGLTYGVIRGILDDPIFHASVDVARIAGFMADSSFRIITRVAMALVVLAAADYGYQFWRTNEDMKMTKEEVKEETKNNEGNPQVKTQRRRKQIANAKRKMLAEVPKADVIVVNPTHLAVALRYDRKTMKAPKIVAKGSRLNALRIREIAQEHQVPIVENVPLARLMFKYGKVGGEIPAELYAAVAEVLAWVYRVNAYRYYREGAFN